MLIFPATGRDVVERPRLVSPARGEAVAADPQQAENMALRRLMDKPPQEVPCKDILSALLPVPDPVRSQRMTLRAWMAHPEHRALLGGSDGSRPLLNRRRAGAATGTPPR